MPSGPELTVVMPAHNEASTIVGSVSAWIDALRRLGVSFEWLAFDDGSSDDTGPLLEHLAATTPELRVIRQSNRGHGPTILAGYRAAQGAWIFQLDGDDEVGPAPFARFWEAREGHDLVLGHRVGRDLAAGRWLLTRASRTAIGMLFGGSVTDANVPYRLMRASAFAPLLDLIPDDTFAPNVALSGLAASRGLRIAERDVPTRPESGQRPANWRLAPTAWRAFRQTLAIATKARR